MLAKYGLIGFVKLIYSLLYTKLFFRGARIIRLPFDIKNKRFIVIGKGFTTGVGCRVEAYPVNEQKVLYIGENVQINDYVHITAMSLVSIGNNVLMASKIYISDCTHGSYLGDENDSNPNSIPIDRPLSSKPVIIEDNVWLGEFVSVLPGVTIGKGTIVGANSVVSKSLPPYVVAIGAPAKPIKRYNFEINKWERI